MKIVITGSLGHISKPLAEELIQKGHSVTVISSKPERQKEIEALGAAAAIGTVEDAGFLTETFKGADAVYTMLPPPSFTDQSLDLKEFSLKIGNNYKQAIELSGIKRVVHLSSVGAHLDKGTGFILLHREMENILGSIPDIGVTFMRPVGFYYNLFLFTQLIKNTGMISSNYGAEDVIPWVSPLDIASAIAKEIAAPLTGKKILYVASEELTCNETAAILGEAIGKPGLQWTLISGEELKSRYESIGMNKQVIEALAEMQANMHNGPIYDDYYKNKPSLGKVKMKDFAKDFAAVYSKA